MHLISIDVFSGLDCGNDHIPMRLWRYVWQVRTVSLFRNYHYLVACPSCATVES